MATLTPDERQARDQAAYEAAETEYVTTERDLRVKAVERLQDPLGLTDWDLQLLENLVGYHRRALANVVRLSKKRGA